ncbi:MAG TPA: hydrogenase 4 subunit F, partial [Candidatus Defluviicoccus seviourii]|nr:hydrogenase 4 subunit F [Candidatus Defluviicoccus seviourii]
IGIGALVLRMQGLAFGPASQPNTPVEASYVPLFAHLALVFAAGVFLPDALVSWFRTVATMIG